jgi:hypothetical protein
MKVSELTGHALDWAVARCEGGVGENQLLGAWYAPSTDWAQGGPIIEREGIELQFDLYRWNAALGVMRFYIGGPTPLVAAMRCYVASKLGKEVEIPTELTQGENK